MSQVKKTVRNYSTLRRNLKRKFIEENLDLCTKVFTEKLSCGWTERWKSAKGRELLELIRKKIGYSSTTSNVDIYVTFSHYWKEITGKKLIDHDNKEFEITFNDEEEAILP